MLPQEYCNSEPIRFARLLNVVSLRIPGQATITEYTFSGLSIDHA